MSAVTEDQREYMQASKQFAGFVINPAQRLLDATQAMVAAAKEREKRAEEALEQLRPVWAQGWTSDSVAAQSSVNALSEIWAFLGVDNQTAAMSRLRQASAIIRDLHGRLREKYDVGDHNPVSTEEVLGRAEAWLTRSVA